MLDLSREDLLQGRYQKRDYIRSDGTPMPLEEYASMRAFRDQQPVLGVEIGMMTESGKTIWTSVSAAPLLIAEKGVVVATVDITERKRAEETLRRWLHIFEHAEWGIAVGSIDGEYLETMNPAFARMHGYTVEELAGRPVLDVFAPPVRGDLPAHIQAANEKSHHAFESEHIRKDGATFPVLVDITTVKDQDGTLLYRIVNVQDITRRRQAEQALAQSREQLRALTAYWQNAIEAERAYIAREIHDEFGQYMTALKMDLTWLVKRLPEGDEKVERIHGMNTLVDDSITMMRRIATQLRPNLLDDLGLNAALEWQAKEFSRHSGISCKLSLPKHDLSLDPDLCTSLFRIFQETLTNVSRHAQATRVEVSLKQKEQAMILTIHDNGRGISENELEGTRSLGLLGLRERAAQWGGETNIHGIAGRGTTVTVRIPLPVLPAQGGVQ